MVHADLVDESCHWMRDDDHVVSRDGSAFHTDAVSWVRRLWARI